MSKAVEYCYGVRGIVGRVVQFLAYSCMRLGALDCRWSVKVRLQCHNHKFDRNGGSKVGRGGLWGRGMQGRKSVVQS